MGLLIFMLIPIWLVIQSGIGFRSGIISVAGAVMILTVVASVDTFAALRQTTTLYMRILAWIRTLAISSVLLTSLIGIVVGFGMGPLAVEQASLLDYGSAIKIWGVVVVISLIIDLVLGGIQVVASRKNMLVDAFM